MTCNVPSPRFEDTPAGLVVRAPAKVNLNLLVGPRRADGFHDLDSLVVKISLYDELSIVPSEAITLTCAGADCGEVESNLVYRAAMLLREHALDRGWAAGESLGARIHLVKRTPPGKGLGGGSSDAAAALLGLWRLWGLDRIASPSAEAALSPLAAQLGSDVPLFLAPSACRMTGRGEILQPLDVAPMAMALFLPDLFCATPAVYRSFDSARLPLLRSSNFAEQAELRRASQLAAAPDASTAPAALAERQLDAACLRLPPSRWRARLVNDLFPAAGRVCPELADLQARIQSHTDIPILMTGSGSALFAPCDHRAEAARLLESLPPDLQRHATVVQTVTCE